MGPHEPREFIGIVAGKGDRRGHPPGEVRINERAFVLSKNRAFFDRPNARPRWPNGHLSQIACMPFAFIVAIDRMGLFTEPA